MEATAVLGSLAGIGEIAKATFGGGRRAAAAAAKTVPPAPRKPTGPRRGFTTPGYTPPSLSGQRHADGLSRLARRSGTG